MATAKPSVKTGTALAVKPKGGALANYKDRLAALAAKNVETEASTVTSSFITLPAGVLTYQDQAMPKNEMRAIIIDSILESTLYEGGFDAKNPRSPICFAFGRNDREMHAHEKSEKPQGAEGHACTGCEHNQWGTGTDNAGNPTRGKACQQRRRLMLLPADALKNGVESIERSEVAFLKLPVTSVKIWSAYTKTLHARYQLPPLAFITRIYVERDQDTQFKVLYEEQEQIEDDDVVEALMNKAEQNQTDMLRPYEKIEPLPTPASRKGAPPAKPRKY